MGEQEMLTVPEAAKLLRLGRDTTYGLVKTGRIPSIRVGRNIRVPRAALLAHLNREAQAAVQSA
jgi:excisionase family DNA binding protein